MPAPRVPVPIHADKIEKPPIPVTPEKFFRPPAVEKTEKSRRVRAAGGWRLAARPIAQTSPRVGKMDKNGWRGKWTKTVGRVN